MKIARVLALTCLLLPGCARSDGESGEPATGEDPTGETDTGGGTETGEALDAPTYYGDVLPLFAQYCQTCHSPGEIGPFPIADYDAAVEWGPAIEAAVAARTMPPITINNSGICNTFRDTPWLTDEEIALVSDWVAAGMPEGDPSAPRPEPPTLDELIGEDIQEIHTPADFVPEPKGTPGKMFDDYRCFPIETGSDAEQFLTGFEVLPGNASIVHHVVGFKVDPERELTGGITNGAIMSLLDNKDEKPGWECFGAAGENVLIDGVPITWAPGGGALNFPGGTGVRFKPGEVVVLQVHYNLLSGDGSDQTTVRLSWADSVARESFMTINDEFLATAFGNPKQLEPGKESVVFSWNAPLYEFFGSGNGDLEVMGVFPHMHEYGRRMQVNYKISGQDDDLCGAYIDRWDFNWQRSYFYEDPIVLRPADRVEVLCEWDTTGVSKPIGPGFGTGDEMCLIGLYVAAVE